MDQAGHSPREVFRSYQPDLRLFDLGHPVPLPGSFPIEIAPSPFKYIALAKEPGSQPGALNRTASCYRPEKDGAEVPTMEYVCPSLGGRLCFSINLLAVAEIAF